VTRLFGFGRLAIRVEADDGHLRWLTELIGPYFEAKPDTALRACCVHLVEDTRRYNAALRAGPAGGAVDALALDAGPLTLPRWRGGETRLFDDRRSLFYDIDAVRRLTVTIVSAAGNRDVRSALFSVVRELATNHAQRAGDLLLHASAFAVDGRGVVIAGPKKAGKTTLLVHALHCGSPHYVSNDRVLVTAETSPRAIGVPTVVRLRRGTLDVFPALARSLDGAGYEHRLTIDEAAARSDARSASPSGARRVSHAQLCRVLDVGARSECGIAALVFPRITEDAGAFAVHPLSRDEVVARLAGALFGIRGGRSTSDAFVLPGAPPAPGRAELAARCRALADRVPGVECRVGADANARPAGTELIAALLPGG
jgi:hypothetical protein